MVSNTSLPGVRENLPGRLAALLSAKPERLLRQLETLYGALVRDIQGPPQPDMLGRLEARSASVDIARKNLLDWMRQRADGDATGEPLVQKVASNLALDIDRMGKVLQGAAALPSAQVKERANDALLPVHAGLRQLRTLARTMVKEFREEAPREPINVDAQKQRRFDQERPQGGVF